MLLIIYLFIVYMSLIILVVVPCGSYDVHFIKDIVLAFQTSILCDHGF